MKQLITRLVFLAMCFMSCTLIYGQSNIEVVGKVVDADGKPISEATIELIHHRTNNRQSFSSNNEGIFTLRPIIIGERYSILTHHVSYLADSIGNFVPTSSNRNTILVRLKSKIGNLDEVVVVGYGTQKKSQLTAAVSTLSSKDIVDVPVANINNSLAGRVPGLLSFQGSGEPGADAANIRVRGIGTIGGNNQALTIVDGIPRDFSQINPNEIENISVLKDAAAIAPYGLAGANGVILITTKRGKAGRVDLGFNTWVGFQRPTQYPNYLNAYDYAYHLNVARQNAGLQPQYTEEQLQKYKDRSDLDHFPDIDWFHDVIDFNAPITNQNLLFTGGSEKVRFFSSLGHLYQQGSVDVINYRKYNLASNVDVNATPTTLVSLDLRASLEVTKNPGSIDGTGIYTQVTKLPPLLVNPLHYTNGKPGNTMLPSIYESGYNRRHENIFFSHLSIEQKLPFLEGLSIKGVFAYDKSYSTNKNWQIPYVYYTLNSKEEYDEIKAGVTAPRLNQGFQERINTTLQGYLTYQRTFGNHGVSLLTVIEQRRGNSNQLNAERINYQVNLDELDMGSAAKNDLSNGGKSSSSIQTGIVYRASYNYKEKYLFEFSGRYDGHYYFAPGKRFAFFPAVSAGWVMSEESFIKDNFNWIDHLKLRGSVGKSGNLAGGPFQYLSSYGLSPSYIFGGIQYQGVFERSEPNPYITWETSQKLDLGFDATLWGGKLGINFDYFKEKRSDMLVQPSAKVPAEYGIGLSQINGGKMNNQGFDLALNSRHLFENGFLMDWGVTVSYAKNKLIEIMEGAETYNNENRRKTGRPLDTQFGLRALGLFQSQEEIDGWAKQFGTVKPGDIKYEDINGDKVINNEDQVVIGAPAFPQLIFGLTGQFEWKNFNLNMLWQGAAQSSFQLTNEASNPYFNGAKIFEEQLDYWTEDNRDAKYPVIMPAPTPNSTQVSSWWIRNGHYLRLKNLELGYKIPNSILKKIQIENLRLFVSGQNLLTFSSEKYLDPEIGVSSASKRARYYFQQKVFTAGININF